MKLVTRFAPSPTGMLHVGNLRTALVCWLFARKNQAKFILRIDDTDYERSKDEYTNAIKADLTWLGLDWAQLEHQRARLDRYKTVIEEMKSRGDVYPAYETQEELSLKRKSALAQGKPPIYDRAALRLTDEARAKYTAEGRQPHWRFKMRDADIEWHDLIRGAVKFAVRDIGDPVVIREDGTPLYHLCSVIDDFDMQVTHIVRGEDHVTNTATHIHMFMALGNHMPQFAHLPLLADAAGEKLSKRIGSLSVQELRKTEGLEPLAIMSLLAKLGTSDPVTLRHDLDALAADFDFSKFSRATARLDIKDMVRLNAQLLHEMPFAEAQPRLAAIGIAQIDENFWNVARQNLERLRDIQTWWQAVHEPQLAANDDMVFVKTAAQLLPAGDVTADTWASWTNAIKEQTGRKGKELFMPLRKALTGMEHGPEMATILPLIGREKTLQRLG